MSRWICTLLGASWVCTAEPRTTTTLDGFAVPQPGYRFSFPRDHGNHPDFKIEWWYITGHLHAAPGRRFGFQATFFRQAGPGSSLGSIQESSITNNSSRPEREFFSHGPFYLAHMALLDVESGTFLHQARLNRAGWDAGSAPDHTEVWNGNWRLDAAPDNRRPELGDGAQLKLHLVGTIRGTAAFELDLEPRKPLVLFGANGLSRKGADPTAASYYLTFPRLAAEGHLDLNEHQWAVEGEAWMDHEISSSQLSAGQVGWDWACLQLDDGREIMTYRMRLADGSTDPFSSLTWIDSRARLHSMGSDQFRWMATGHWKSALTQADYPNQVRLLTRDPETGKEAVFQLEPLAKGQELADELGGVAYWEGACKVRNAEGREIGKAFLELAGYAGNLAANLGSPENPKPKP